MHYGRIASIGLLLGVLAWAGAWFAGNLTPLGAALLAAIVAIASWVAGVAIEAHGRRRAVLVVVTLLIVALGVVDVTQLERHAPPGVSELVGGCTPYRLFAQNRWQPFGAALRAEPMVESKQLGNFDPNQSIPVDGWVRTRAAYPSNSAPWNSDVWFHVYWGSGWVSFAGTRADPSTPSGTDDGRPSPAPMECSGSVR
jgi:hypothetical protein